MPIKFIDMSYADIETTSILTVSSGATLLDRLRDRRFQTQWSSIGSNDTITETLTIDFGTTKTVDYIQLLNMNWKEFTIKYDVTGTPTDFSIPINETVNIDENKIYNNFTGVNTTKIYITITKTIIVNQQKAIGELIISQVLGTLIGYPSTTLKLNKNKIIKKMLRGRIKVVDRDETTTISLQFKTYPIDADMILIESLWERTNPFYILLSGNSESDFTYLRRGWRDEDMKLVAIVGDYDPNYYKNLYFSGVDFSIDFQEV